MRITWDEYFSNIVHQVKLRSTCFRRQVGAVIVKNNKIISTGYNGVPRGLEHCKTCVKDELNLEHGKDYELCNSVHAEMNCLMQAGN